MSGVRVAGNNACMHAIMHAWVAGVGMAGVGVAGVGVASVGVAGAGVAGVEWQL